jgi:hypothetical protein
MNEFARPSRAFVAILRGPAPAKLPSLVLSCPIARFDLMVLPTRVMDGTTAARSGEKNEQHNRIGNECIGG